jgi:hypothetical protein
VNAWRDSRTALSDEVRDHLQGGQQGARGDGGALIYRFETPQGSLLYQDTCGHWTGVLRGLQSDVAILAAAGRGNVDGEPWQTIPSWDLIGTADHIIPRAVDDGHAGERAHQPFRR